MESSLLIVFRSLFTVLLFTIGIEAIPLLFLKPRKQWVPTGLLCNVLTNPLLNTLRILIYSLYPNEHLLWILTLCMEVLVVLGEGWFYRELVHVSTKKALLVSSLCNCLSFGIGLWIL